MTRIADRKTARKVGAPCEQCGREFWVGKRDGRKRRFCSNKCRQAAFRNAEFARRYPGSPALRNVPKNPILSTACKGDFADRPSVDPALWRRVVEIETAGMWTGGREITSPDGVVAYVMRERQS